MAIKLNRHPVYYFDTLAQKYGDVYTFWLGSEPIIVVNDCHIAKSLLNKTEFSDRFEDSIQDRLSELIVDKNIGFANYDEECIVLRKVSIEALRYSIMVL